MLSFGHAVFFGLGSYAAMHAMIAIDDASYAGEGFWAHVPVVGMPVIGMIAGGLVALVLGWPFCRRAGTAFAMITLGLGEMVAAAGQMFPSLFGGEAGIYGNRMVGPQWFGLELAQSADVYWFMAFWTFVAVFAMWAFTRTPLGRMSNAVRDNPDRLQFIGYQPRNIRFMIFIASGSFGGLAGGMAAVNYEIITPEALGLILRSGAADGGGGRARRVLRSDRGRHRGDPDELHAQRLHRRLDSVRGPGIPVHRHVRAARSGRRHRTGARGLA